MGLLNSYQVIIGEGYNLYNAADLDLFGRRLNLYYLP